MPSPHTPTPTLILVHGAWHGAWCWSAFESELRARGVPAHALELTSHGAQGAAVGDLRSDVELLRRTVREVDGPVVLLGHSYGGLVVTEGAEGLDNVTRLIYLSAFLPGPGDSMVKMTGGGNAPWIHRADGLMTIAAGWGEKLFYSDCPPDLAAKAESQLAPQSAVSFQQEVRATAWQQLPSTYIVCTEDRAIAPDGQRRMAAMAGCEVVELRSGHSPFMTQPDRLADLLLERL
ncbi:alpha/beta hydrolase [Streptomyces sp. NPDC002888]|uniref:alpha/beta hydrolase n=1 Tax=Streptomyces sp. NPDC002888 TaxID=3364668 RepID=UPI00369A62AD